MNFILYIVRLFLNLFTLIGVLMAFSGAVMLYTNLTKAPKKGPTARQMTGLKYGFWLLVVGLVVTALFGGPLHLLGESD
ncbi:hypothetical protein [Rhodococcus baikonurensis]|uniref:Uncharacterized protein n=1 Tax=Rhodococcus baikonurensis TaxID=172041 RepID=A0ABV5XFG4_9NOCA